MTILNSDKRYLANAAIQFAFGLIHCVFNFYYVKVFLNIYRVSEWWFQFSQVIFMIWNAVNDPMIGFLLNNPKWACFKNRRLPILYGGPIIVIAFLLPWFSWRDYAPGDWVCGVHLLVSLCVYDALFSYIGLTSCCLTTEMFTDYQQRVKMKWYHSMATLASAWSIPFCNLVSNNLDNFVYFQMATVFLGVLALLSFTYAGRNCYTVYELGGEALENVTSGPDCFTSGSKCAPPKCLGEDTGTVSISSWRMACLVLRSRDFQSYVWTEFFQIIHLTFWSSFTTIMVDNLVQTTSAVKSGLFGLVAVLPAILFIIFRRVFEVYGYYRIINWNIASSIVMGVGMYLIGPNPLLFMMFILADTVICESTMRLCDVILADIVDKIKTDTGLKHPSSSVLVGLNAMVVKPAQSVAPMLTVAILNRAGYQALVDGDLAKDATALGTLHSTMFGLSCAIPVCVGVIQAIIWSRYTIRSNKFSSEMEI